MADYREKVRTIADAAIAAAKMTDKPTLSGMMFAADLAVEVVGRLAEHENLTSEQVEAYGQLFLTRFGNGLINWGKNETH